MSQHNMQIAFSIVDLDDLLAYVDPAKRRGHGSEPMIRPRRGGRRGPARYAARPMSL